MSEVDKEREELNKKISNYQSKIIELIQDEKSDPLPLLDISSGDYGVTVLNLNGSPNLVISKLVDKLDSEDTILDGSSVDKNVLSLSFGNIDSIKLMQNWLRIAELAVYDKMERSIPRDITVPRMNKPTSEVKDSEE